MAIKIIKDAAGAVAKVEGLRDARQIPLNAYLCEVTVGNGGITIYNPDSTTDLGVPTKIMDNVPYTEFVKSDGSVPVDAIDLKADIDAQLAEVVNSSGYSHTGAFADKPVSNQYVWQSGAGINYTQADVNANSYKVFSLSRAVHEAVDNPYWTSPAPTGDEGIGLFQGAYLPSGASTLVDYDYSYDAQYPTSSGTGFEGSTGRIKLNDVRVGDRLQVRFDFNIIPQVANTTIEPALWYSNRDANDDITFTFPLTSQPIFFGTGTVANTYLNRVDISAWIASDEDINALTLPAIKSDNPVIIQPLGLFINIIR